MYSLTAGDTFSFAGPIMDLDTNVPFDLTGKTIAAEIYKYSGDNVNPVVGTKVDDLVATIVTPSTGQITLYRAKEATVSWPVGLLVIRLKIITGADVFSTYSRAFAVIK